MSDGMETAVSVTMTRRVVTVDGEAAGRRASYDDLASDVEPGVSYGDDEDLTRLLEKQIKAGVSTLSRDLQELISDLETMDPVASPSGQSVNWLATLFQRRKANAGEELARIIEARNILHGFDKIATSFPDEFKEYQLSLAFLNSTLEDHPGYIGFLQKVDGVSASRGVKADVVRSMINDPFQKGDDIVELRTMLTDLIADPAVKPHFDNVETRFQNMQTMMRDLADGMTTLGAKHGMNMNAFRDVEELMTKMAPAVVQAPLSRPGGVVMDGDKNGLTEQMKRVAKNIRRVVEAIMQGVKAKMAPGMSPSMSV